MHKLFCAGTAAILVAMVGCKTTDERTEGRTIDDKQITASVEKSLEQEPTYKFTQVKVKTFAGVVQLSGFVNTESEKARAAEIAQNTDGVRQVANGITLKPEMPATGRAQSRIYSEPNAPVTPQAKESN